MHREKDIRNAIRQRLIDTNEYDGVFLGAMPDYQGEAASLGAAVFIEPGDTSENSLSDDAPAGMIEYACRIKFTFVARDQTPEIRDALCENLFATASNALNGQVLVEALIVPTKTRFTNWRWIDPTAPERRIAATFQADYLIDGWDELDTEE